MLCISKIKKALLGAFFGFFPVFLPLGGAVLFHAFGGVGIGLRVNAFDHALEGGAGAYLDELGGAVGKHVLHGGGPADGSGELHEEVLISAGSECGRASTFW